MKEIFSIVWDKQNKKLFKLFRPKVAKIYYYDYSLDLISYKKNTDTVFDLFEILKSETVSDSEYKNRLIHFHYECGFLFNKLDSLCLHDRPLAITLEYEEREEFQAQEHPSVIGLKSLKSVNYESYFQQFQKVQENLRLGNCYQLNLTSTFKFKIKDGLDAENLCEQFFNDQNQLGEFAHASFLAPLNKLILSNSPESLFNLKFKDNEYSIQTRPIKGSRKIDANSDIDKEWRNLLDDKKERGELYMIADLLRNDLIKISGPPCNIVKEREKLIVPGILHQYSLLESKVKADTSFYQILHALFPGGSITGAPKKRVMEITHKIEDGPRGIYTGSTLIQLKGETRASINIRTADIDINSNTLSYGSGGGVTLLSKAPDEYNEMKLKLKSFMQLLIPNNKILGSDKSEKPSAWVN